MMQSEVPGHITVGLLQTGSGEVSTTGALVTEALKKIKYITMDMMQY